MPGEVEARSPVYGQDWRCPVLETDKDGGQSLTRLGGIALLGLSFLGLLGSSMNPELLDSVHLSSSLHLSTRCHHLQQHQRGARDGLTSSVPPPYCIRLLLTLLHCGSSVDSTAMLLLLSRWRPLV